MPEKESISQPKESQLKTAELVLEKYQEILDKVDSGVKPKDLAEEYNIEVLAELLNALGFFLGSSQPDKRMPFAIRFRIVEKAWRLKAIEEEHNKVK